MFNVQNLRPQLPRRRISLEAHPNHTPANRRLPTRNVISDHNQQYISALRHFYLLARSITHSLDRDIQLSHTPSLPCIVISQSAYIECTYILGLWLVDLLISIYNISNPLYDSCHLRDGYLRRIVDISSLWMPHRRFRPWVIAPDYRQRWFWLPNSTILGISEVVQDIPQLVYLVILFIPLPNATTRELDLRFFIQRLTDIQHIKQPINFLWFVSVYSVFFSRWRHVGWSLYLHGG